MNPVKKYYKGYQYYSFYQKFTNKTKIIINIKLDNCVGSPYTNISEISLDGEFTEPEIDFLAMAEINDIEKLY
jgi:hypothetical protein